MLVISGQGRDNTGPVLSLGENYGYSGRGLVELLWGVEENQVDVEILD